MSIQTPTRRADAALAERTRIAESVLQQATGADREVSTLVRQVRVPEGTVIEGTVPSDGTDRSVALERLFYALLARDVAPATAGMIVSALSRSPRDRAPGTPSGRRMPRH